VRATNNLVFSDWSDEVKCTILLPVPLAPSGLFGTAMSPTQINLAWTDNSSNETAFALWRRTGAGSWVRVAVLGPNVTTFSDTSVSASTTYTYRVRAINNGGASAWSDEMTVTTTS